MTLSLQKRLTWILLALTLFAWVASAAVTYFYANRVLLEQVDRQLGQYADLVTYITRVFERQLAEGQPLYEAWSGHDYDQAHRQPIIIEGLMTEGLAAAINVWEGHNMIALVEGSPTFQQPTEGGFEYLDMEGHPGQWRLLSRYDELTGVWIRVGIELGAARQDMLGTLGRSLLPLMIVLPLTIGLLYLGVLRGLLPVRNLAEQISRRKPGLLDPVNTEGVPEELSPVVSSLNQLLTRLAEALEAEQRFTANAAHELLTPLAAIKTEVQLCQRQLPREDTAGAPAAGTPAAGAPAANMLARITERVDRASHTVEQLLTLARVDPEAPVTMSEVNVGELLAEVLADTAHLAADRGLEVALDNPAGNTVQGNAEALAILMRNLLVNAFRYSSGDPVISIRLTQERLPQDRLPQGRQPQDRLPQTNESLTLEVCNDCEPLSATEHARLGDRFYRVPGSAGLGAGLGLSIASRIAELHGARLETGPGEGGRRGARRRDACRRDACRGFCARVCFPQPA